MKNKLYLFLGIVGLLFCVAFQNKPQPNDTEINSVQADCNSMVNFMKATLYENYGNSLAFDRFWEKYQQFHGAYVLQVNQQKLLKLNEQLYKGAMFSYFVDEFHWKPFEERRTGEGFDSTYVAADGRTNQVTVERKVNLSSRYECFTPVQCLDTKDSYLNTALANATHPFLKSVYEWSRPARDIPSWVNTHFEEFGVPAAFRAGDKDVQLFVSFYLWQYLCYCANVDVFTGEPKRIG